MIINKKTSLKGEEPKERQFLICGYNKSKSKFSPLHLNKKILMTVFHKTLLRNYT